MRQIESLKSIVPWRWLALVACLFLAGCAGMGQGSNSADSVTFAFGIAALTFVVAFAGGAVPLLARFDHQHSMLGAMTSISAGFLISAACLIVIPEGFERFSVVTSSDLEAGTTAVHSEDDGHDHSGHNHGEEAPFLGLSVEPSVLAGMAILLGFLLMLVTESLGFGHDIHEEHHNDAGGHVHHPISDQDGKRLGAVVVIGLTIHTIADGMAIGAGLATGSHALTGSLVATLLTHKVPAAFSLAMFSQHAHGSRRKTWTDLWVFSLATPIAILGTWAVLGSLSDRVVGWVLLFSAGTFIYVATVDVLPNVLRSGRRRVVALQVAAGCLALLFLILILDGLGFGLHDHG